MPLEHVFARPRLQIPDPAVQMSLIMVSDLIGVILVMAAETHLTLLSYEPDTTVLPSELRATLPTESVWPSSVDLHTPDSRSQIM